MPKLAGETVHFLSKKGSFSAISHYVRNECRPSTVFYSIAIFVSKKAPVCCKNANLTDGTRFTYIRGGYLGFLEFGGSANFIFMGAGFLVLGVPPG